MDCPLYRVHVSTIQSKDTTGQRQHPRIQTVRVPWCAHKHTPIGQVQAQKGMGGAAAVLKCGGSLAACQVSAADRAPNEHA